MSEFLEDELIHLHCAKCGQITSVSLGQIHHQGKPICGACGEPLPVSDKQAESDALRESQELDDSLDSLGAHE